MKGARRKGGRIGVEPASQDVRLLQDYWRTDGCTVEDESMDRTMSRTRQMIEAVAWRR
jgi:hypothetical protein